jgi:hypothetical protein
MENKKIEYEIYALNSYESDVVYAYSLQEAIEIAEKWSMDEIDTDIAVVKVEKTKIKSFRNGGEVA